MRHLDCKAIDHAVSGYRCNPPDALIQSLQLAEQLKPAVEELMLSKGGSAYQVVSKCDLELELTHANKGVEGIQYYDAGDRGM